MATPASPAGSMKLVGGDPCLDFVNTVGGRADQGAARVLRDKLASYADLVAFALHARLLAEPEGRALLRRAAARPREAAAVLARAKALREALYRTLLALMRAERPPAPDLALVGDALAAARGHEVLDYVPPGLGWQWRGAPGQLDAVLWPVLRAASSLLTSGATAHLRRCAGSDCGWLFLDRSRNRRRQWCTMEDCGNVAKVRRFRERQRSGAGGR